MKLKEQLRINLAKQPELVQPQIAHLRAQYTHMASNSTVYSSTPSFKNQLIKQRSNFRPCKTLTEIQNSARSRKHGPIGPKKVFSIPALNCSLNFDDKYFTGISSKLVSPAPKMLADSDDFDQCDYNLLEINPPSCSKRMSSFFSNLKYPKDMQSGPVVVGNVLNGKPYGLTQLICSETSISEEIVDGLEGEKVGTSDINH